MIKINQISKTFNDGTANAIKAIDNVSLFINKNDYLIIVGSNGSGKSSLLKCIAGEILINSGKIFFENNEVSDLNDFERAKWISRVFQNPLQGTAPNLSIIENFRLATLRTKNKNIFIGIDEKFIGLVKEKISILKLGLENKINQPMGSLSGGQRQALTLLMSVFDDSKILLLDEPTAALDPKSASIVMETANNLHNNLALTTVLVTHNMKDAINYGNRIIKMEEGKIVKDILKEDKDKLTTNEIFGWF